jgi:phage gp45-like
MSNFLRNGTVLPSGLLSQNHAAKMEGFKRTYQNTALKIGVITASYGISDPLNINKLFVEYDVLVFEQYENKGSGVSIYKNCTAAKSLGSIADYFEMTLRPIVTMTTDGTVPHLSGQDGSVVMLLCLNGFSDTGVIVGALDNPDRPTMLTDTTPHLEAEYNGVHITILNDGSTSLTFKGATDNSGTPTDSSQGNTVVSIATDGSFQVQHSTITFTLAKNGVATLTSSGDLNVNCDNATITANSNINATCKDATVTASDTATVDGKTVNLGASASDAVIKGTTFQTYFNTHIHTTVLGPSGPPIEPMPPTTLSMKVNTE